MGYFIILVDTSLVFTCSKEISSSLHMNPSSAAWISNAYALTFGSLLLLGGKLGDIFGRRRLFILGLMIFGISSTLVGLSPTATLLIIFRALHGIGAAIIAPATLAIIMDSFTGNNRVVAISMYGAVSGIGVSLGLIIGAGITTLLSWR
ncbi:MFS transporter [Companilactobacillus kimchiensis]|nr:MFS transporter [Companilactobacillus kimchiensis]